MVSRQTYWMRCCEREVLEKLRRRREPAIIRKSRGKGWKRLPAQ